MQRISQVSFRLAKTRHIIKFITKKSFKTQFILLKFTNNHQFIHNFVTKIDQINQISKDLDSIYVLIIHIVTQFQFSGFGLDQIQFVSPTVYSFTILAPGLLTTATATLNVMLERSSCKVVCHLQSVVFVSLCHCTAW